MGGHPHDLARRLLAPWRNFRARGFIFLEESLVIRLWDVLVALGVAYSVLFLPLVMVFPQAQWHGYRALNTFIDTSLMIDVVVRFRTSFVDRGYPVLTSRLIALRYCRGWFIYDLLSSFPFTSFASNEGNVLRSTPTTAYALELTPLGMLSLLRVFSIGRLIRIIALVNSSQLVRQRPLAAVVLPVACLMFFFVLMAHYLGLVWYLIAVRPLEIDESFDGAQQWFWLQPAPFSAAYVVGVRYVCSLYWALGVMTNLKGLPAHETRQCLWHDPLVTNPLAERVFTIFVFIIGACFFSAIYGNIATFIQNLYAGGVRYRRRMDEVDELSRFYQIEGSLQRRIRTHVDFTWAVTKGINMSTMAGGLPRHLQLEITLRLNRPMVAKCPLFADLDEGLVEDVVSKLQFMTIIAGEFVFYEGMPGSRMFFISRGSACVMKGGTVLATLTEGNYFGELGLLTDAPRSSDVVATTNLMLMALSADDFNHLLSRHPRARERIENVAEQRVQQQRLASQREATRQRLQDGGASPDSATRPHAYEHRRRSSFFETVGLSFVKKYRCEGGGSPDAPTAPTPSPARGRQKHSSISADISCDYIGGQGGSFVRPARAASLMCAPHPGAAPYAVTNSGDDSFVAERSRSLCDQRQQHALQQPRYVAIRRRPSVSLEGGASMPTSSSPTAALSRLGAMGNGGSGGPSASYHPPGPLLDGSSSGGDTNALLASQGHKIDLLTERINDLATAVAALVAGKHGGAGGPISLTTPEADRQRHDEPGSWLSRLLPPPSGSNGGPTA